MARLNTRGKVRWQSAGALVNLRKAENHLLQIAGIADGRSDYINDNLPQIVTSLHFIIETMEKFDEGL